MINKRTINNDTHRNTNSNSRLIGKRRPFTQITKENEINNNNNNNEKPVLDLPSLNMNSFDNNNNKLIQQNENGINNNKNRNIHDNIHENKNDNIHENKKLRFIYNSKYFII